MDAAQLGLQLGAGDRVERPERLVHQQHGGMRGQRAGNADPLLLATREHVRVGVAQAGVVQAEQGEQLGHPRLGARPGPAEQVRYGRDVAGYGPVRE